MVWILWIRVHCYSSPSVLNSPNWIWRDLQKNSAVRSPTLSSEICQGISSILRAKLSQRIFMAQSLSASNRRRRDSRVGHRGEQQHQHDHSDNNNAEDDDSRPSYHNSSCHRIHNHITNHQPCFYTLGLIPPSLQW